MPEDRRLTVVANWRDLEHPQAGGAELVCDRLARRFAAEGRTVVLLSSAVRGRPRTERVDGYTVHRRGGRLTVYAWALLWLWWHRRRVDLVVDSQNGIPFFSPLALRRRTPCVMLLHHIHQEQFAHYFPAPVARFGRFLEGPVSRVVYGHRAVIAVSPSTRQGARQRLRLRGAVSIAPPGWDVTLDLGRRLPDKTGHPSLVTVGRLVPHKRTGLAIHALARVLPDVPGATLDVVGAGPELASLRALASDLGVERSVTFHPGCSNDERDRVLARSWLCLTPSEGEGWGISVIEANALGTPVLAFDRPGLRDSVKHGSSGWLVEEGDPLEDQVRTILRSLRDPRRQSATARDCHAWAMRFTWDQMGTRVLDAVSVERRRLRLGRRDRRRHVDVSTVVRFPSALLPLDWAPALRETDRMAVRDGVVEMFLSHADTSDALSVLDQLGVPHVVADPDFSIRVATRMDHLAPLAV